MAWILFVVLLVTTSAEDSFDESLHPNPDIDPALILAALFPHQNPLVSKLEPNLPRSSLSYLSPLPLRGQQKLQYLPSDLETNELSSSIQSNHLSSAISPREEYLVAGKHRRPRSLEEAIRVQFPTEHVFHLDDGTLVVSEDSPVSGGFKYSFQSPSGLSRSEVGDLKQISPDFDPVVVVRGSYSYLNPEGNTVAVQYTADENGFISTNV